MKVSIGEKSKRDIRLSLLTNARDGMEIDFNINGLLAARDANVSPVLTSIAVYRSCRIDFTLISA